MIAIKSKQIVYDLGSTGGEFAAHCLYYAERLRKKSVIVDTLHRQWDVDYQRCQICIQTRLLLRW